MAAEAGWQRAQRTVNKVRQLNVFGYRTRTSCAKSGLKIVLEVSSQLGNLGDFFYSHYSLTFVILQELRLFKQRQLFIGRPRRFSLKI